jgi:glycosyltransferase involved in cell wall biosynthesis
VRLHVAGRIDDAKGVLAFMAQLMPRLPAHWRVDVFGEGPRRTDLERLVDARVTLHGHRPVAEVLASCATATLAVVPSQWEEPWGNVTAEALRLGVPCYALRRGGTPELARYGAPGQLRLFASMAALVDALVADVDAAAPLPEPITARGPQAGESADVRQRLHQIIPIYEATARRAR